MIYQDKYYYEELIFNTRPYNAGMEMIQMHAYFNSTMNPGFESKGNLHPYALYSVTLSGSYQSQSDKGKITITPGTFTISPVNRELRKFRVIGKIPLERKCCMVYRNALHDMIVSQLGFGGGGRLKLQDVAAVSRIMDSICEIMRDQNYSEPHLSGVFFELLQEVYSQQQRNNLPDPLNTALGYINAHFQNSTLSCREIAAHAGVSTRSLNRLFGQYLDRQVSQYINHVRLEHVRSMLARPYLRINEIAEQCGFASAGFMSRQFRRHYHKTPSEYRQ